MEQQPCLKISLGNIIWGILFVLNFYGCSGREEVKHEVVTHASEIVYVTDPDSILEGPVISCPQQILNLKDGGLLFLKLGIQFSDLTKPESESVLTARYMDGVIQLASEYTSSDLTNESGQVEFKDKLIIKLNELSEGEATVTKIFFETLLVR